MKAPRRPRVACQEGLPSIGGRGLILRGPVSFLLMHSASLVGAIGVRENAPEGAPWCGSPRRYFNTRVVEGAGLLTLLRPARTATASLVNGLYVIAVMTSLNCGVDVLCFRAVESDLSGKRARTYPTGEACVVALDHLTKAQRGALHQRNLRCVRQGATFPYVNNDD